MGWTIYWIQWRIHKEVAEVSFAAKVTEMESQQKTMDLIPTNQHFSKCFSVHQTLLGIKICG